MTDGVLFPHIGDHHPQLRYLPAQFPQQILGETKPLELRQNAHVFDDAVPHRSKAAELSKPHCIDFGPAVQRFPDTRLYFGFRFFTQVMIFAHGKTRVKAAEPFGFGCNKGQHFLPRVFLSDFPFSSHMGQKFCVRI